MAEQRQGPVQVGEDLRRKSLAERGNSMTVQDIAKAMHCVELQRRGTEKLRKAEERLSTEAQRNCFGQRRIAMEMEWTVLKGRGTARI